MTLREFRQLTAHLPDDAVIAIKAQDEFFTANIYGDGFQVRKALTDGSRVDPLLDPDDDKEQVEEMEADGFKWKWAAFIDVSD